MPSKLIYLNFAFAYKIKAGNKFFSRNRNKFWKFTFFIFEQNVSILISKGSEGGSAEKW